SPQATAAATNSASPTAVTEAGRRTFAATSSPSARNARYASARLKYAHERSGAIDQTIVSPFQTTNAAISPTNSQPKSSSRGSRSNPVNAAAHANAAPTAAAPPTQPSRSSLDPALASTAAPVRAAPTPTSTASPRPRAIRMGSEITNASEGARPYKRLTGGLRAA